MRHPIRFACLTTLLSFTPLALHAQGIGDFAARVAPQALSYKVDSPIGETITEFAVPIFAAVPLSPSFSFDVGSAWASTKVDLPDGSTSQVSGLTDTQLRGNYTLGNDLVVLTAGVNLPTGKSAVTLSQLTAASRMGSDFLAMPITALGSGFGVTGGIAVAKPMGEWNVGGALGVRHSSAFDPVDDPTAGKLHFVPGNEYRVRFGADRPAGTGRLSLGMTLSAFGTDQSGAYTYNTGTRLIAQASYVNTQGIGDLTLVAWDLMRGATTSSDSAADPATLGKTNITNVYVGYAMHPANITVEPSVEVRGMVQDMSLPSTMTRFGVRFQLGTGEYALTPAASYAIGKFGGSTSASMTGWGASLGIQLH